MPEQLDTKILPMLPLQTGVVLPHMEVTLTLESAEARAAVEAARSAGDTLLLVPRTAAGAYARVGTVAVIEEMGRTPGGAQALVIRGLHRALIGSGVAGTGEAI
jgi:ATP-dependent Lon protease